MPLALIAVALLVAGAFYGAVCASIERGTGNAESTIAEFSSVEDEVERARITIESGLGDIITGLSNAGSGTIRDRSEAFGSLADRMFDEKFPSTCRGVRTEVAGSDIRLGLESMRLTETEILGGASSASYLKASGTVDLVFSSESTVSRMTLEVEADATSALPLLAEASTRFELSLDGGSSALTQMVEYQLNALAAKRILGGYGSMSAYGDRGTASIITQKDVEKAVRISLDVLEAMYFRDCGDEELLSNGLVDIGDLVTIEDGYLVLDIGALYAQAILQKADEYALQWIDYLGIDLVSEGVDLVKDTVKNIVRWCTGHVDKNQPKKESVNYIKKQMSKAGYSKDDYAYFLNGQKLELQIEGFSIGAELDDDSGYRTYGGGACSIPYPDVDLLDWDGWHGFLKDYQNQTNQFKESLRAALKSMALNSVDRFVIRMPVSAFDEETFASELERCVEAAVEGSLEGFVKSTSDAIVDSGINDPVMGSAYKEIRDNRYEIFEVSKFRRSFTEQAEAMSRADGSYDKEIMDGILERMDVEKHVDDYERMVDERVGYLEIFSNAKKNKGIAVTVASSVGGFLKHLDLESKVGKVALGLAREMSEHIEISAYSEARALPGTDRFLLGDGKGNVHTEKLRVEDSPSLRITVDDPIRNSGRNIHYVGFFEDRTARYSSVFTVRISGDIGYTVTGTNPIHEALGMTDSRYTGSASVDAELNIACMTAWALSGVEYEASNTLLGDVVEAVKEALLKILDVVLEPMMPFMKASQQLADACSTAMVEFGNELNMLMQRIYDTISVPMEFLNGIIDDLIRQCVDAIVVDDILIQLGSQKLSLTVLGMKVTVETNLRSLQKNTKEYVTVTIEKEIRDDLSIKASMALKNKNGSDIVIITGGASGDDWRFDMTIDPMMSSKSYFASVEGRIRDVKFSGKLPEVVQYQIIDFTTNDIPGVGEMLSNIVLPLLGYKCSVEMGVYAKYDLPVETGLLINEVELNPPGSDSGAEWIELFNNTDEPVDLLGYTIVPSDSDKKAFSIGDVTIGAHEKEVIHLKGQALNNNGSTGSKSGIRLALYDTYGSLVDRTPGMRDVENNDFTWQRTSDGSVNWSFMPGTEGERNNGSLPGGFAMKTLLIDFAKDAAVEVLDEMGDVIEGTEMFLEYAERVMARIIDKFIDCVADSLVEACAFVKVELADYTEMQHFGIKVMLGLDSDIIADTLRYLAALIPVIGDHIACPEGLTAETILMDDVFLRTMVYTGVSMPKFLKAVEVQETDVAISVKVNLSAVSTLFGNSVGTWRAEAGMVFENIPTAAVPPAFNAEKYMKTDFWLFRMVFEPARLRRGGARVPLIIRGCSPHPWPRRLSEYPRCSVRMSSKTRRSTGRPRSPSRARISWTGRRRRLWPRSRRRAT